MKTILVPIDFSPVTDAVVEQALALAHSLAGRVELVHAVQPPVVVSDLSPLVGEVVQFTDEIERGARHRLQAMQQRLKKRGENVDTFCAQGFPTRLILARAQERAADYIVIGSHGHTAFYDLIVGSTTSGILKHASCPVVVVPAQPKRLPKRQRPRPVARRRVLATSK